MDDELVDPLEIGSALFGCRFVTAMMRAAIAAWA
jgi:hypothetical protein